MSRSLPIVDVTPLQADADTTGVAREIEAACRASGFFYVTGHGVRPELLERLDAAAREFFALPEQEKLEIAMARGGRAWRGYFPVGGELTRTKEAAEVAWVTAGDLDDYDIHPAIRLRITHGLSAGRPYVG